MLFIVLLLPFMLGCISFFSKKPLNRAFTAFLLAGQAAVVVLLVCVAFGVGALATPSYSIADTLTFALKADRFGLLFCLLAASAWLITIPYCSVYLHHEENVSRFYGFFFLAEAMVLGTALAANLVTLYIFYELTTLLSAPMVLHNQSKKALAGASKYIYYSVGGAFLVLMGMVMLQSVCGTLTFTAGGVLHGAPAPLVLAAVFCVVMGFGSKAGLYPLHNWLPSAHPVAPAPASALLSGIIAKVGVVGIIRTVYFLVGAEHLRHTWVQYTWLTLGMLTVFLGSFMGCTEKVLKKRLAYSSISQISYILLGIFILTPAGLVGALLQLIFHAIAKVGMFLTAGSVIYLDEVTTMDRFRGLGRRMPITLASFALLSLSLVGIPPFGGFHSKWQLALAGLDGLSGAVAYIMPAVLLVSALMTAGYLFPPVMQAFFPGEDAPKEARIREPLALVLPLAVLGVLGFALGLFGDSIVAAVQSIVSTML